MGDLPEDQITLRALRDVNVPKFLKDDLPLFELGARGFCLKSVKIKGFLRISEDFGRLLVRNIISDLFPDTDRPVVEYGNLTPVMEACSKEQNLQLTENFTIKESMRNMIL